MRISDWSSDVCSSDLCLSADGPGFGSVRVMATCMAMGQGAGTAAALSVRHGYSMSEMNFEHLRQTLIEQGAVVDFDNVINRSEEHTSELQSLMRISSAVFCLKQKNNNDYNNNHTHELLIRD